MKLVLALTAAMVAATPSVLGSNPVQTYVESMRCSVVRDFCGHGLGVRSSRLSIRSPTGQFKPTIVSA